MNSSHEINTSEQTSGKKDYNYPLITFENNVKHEYQIMNDGGMVTLKEDVVACIMSSYTIAVIKILDDAHLEVIAQASIAKAGSLDGISKSPSGNQFATWERVSTPENSGRTVVRMWILRENKLIEQQTIELPYRLCDFIMTEDPEKYIYKYLHQNKEHLYFEDKKMSQPVLLGGRGCCVRVRLDGKIIVSNFLEKEGNSLLSVLDENANFIYSIPVNDEQIDNIYKLTENKWLVQINLSKSRLLDLETKQFTDLDIPPLDRRAPFISLGESQFATFSMAQRMIIIDCSSLSPSSIKQYIIENTTADITCIFRQFASLSLTKGSNNIALARRRAMNDFWGTEIQVLRFHDGHTLAQEKLKQKSELNEKNAKAYSLLHRAVSLNSAEMVQLYIEQGCDIEAKDAEKNTPLLLAIKEECWDAAKCLIKNGANVFARNAQSEPALQVLIANYSLSLNREGRCSVGQQLINAGAGIHCDLNVEPQCVEWFIENFDLQNRLFFGAMIDDTSIEETIEFEDTSIIATVSDLKKVITSHSINLIKKHNQLISAIAEYPDDEALKQAVEMITTLSAYVSLKTCTIFKVAKLAHGNEEVKERLHKEAPAEVIEQVAQVKLGN